MGLNLQEAEQDEGSTDNLWITLDSMGFSKQLFLDEAFPCEMEINVEAGSDALMMTVREHEVLRDVSNRALIELTKSRGVAVQVI